MKIKSVLLAFLAGALALVSCQEKEELGTPKVTVTPTELSFAPDGGTQSVTLTATRDWVVTCPDWISVDNLKGEASTKSVNVSITVLPNGGHNRSGNVIFSIGLAKASVTINQEGSQGAVELGDGTKEKPYTVAGVIAYLDELGADVNSSEKVYVKGKVSAISEAFSAQFGNGSFTISDDGTTAADQFTAYRVLYLGNKKWKEGDTQVKVGDDVILYGNVVNYKGNTPETQQNAAFLFSLNGVDKGGDTGGSGSTAEAKGSGTKDDPFNVAAAINAVKDLTWTSTTEFDKVGPFYVKGKVSSVSEEFSAQYGNGTFNLVDEGFDAEFIAYRVLYLGNKKWKEGQDQIKAGDEVIVYAELMNYRGNTPETSGGYIYSLNGKTDGGSDEPAGEVKGSGTKEDPFNVAAALNAVKNLTWTANDNYEKVGPYYVKGKISEIKEEFSAQHGNAQFTMVDEGSNAGFIAYRVLYLGNRKWKEGDTQIKVGDEVIIYAELMNYRGNTPESVQNSGYLYSLNGVTEGGSEPAADYNNAEARTVAQFIAAADKDTYFKLTGTVSKFNATYCSFDLTDDTGTIYVYSVDNKADWSSKISNGGTVTLAGKYAYYATKEQHEVVNAYILSFEKGGSDTPQPGNPAGKGTVEDPFNVAAAIDYVTKLGKDVTSEGSVYIKGKISSIEEEFASKFGNATFYMADEGSDATFYAYRVLYLGNRKWAEGDSQIKVGDEAIICGKVVYYQGNTPETTQGNAYLYSLNGKTDGGGSDTPEPPVGEAKAVTVQEFLAAEESQTQLYQLTGTIGGSINSTYGNFDLTDETGTVYVYGLTATNLGYGAQNDKSFASLNLSEGDNITIIGYRGSFNGKDEVLNAYFVKKNAGGDTPDNPPTPATNEYGSTVGWELGEKGYTQEAVVNGKEGVSILKLGTGSAAGVATLTVPEDAETLTFYAISWKGKPATLVLSKGGTKIGSVEPAANDGLAGNPTYTLTVTDSDRYTVNLKSSVGVNRAFAGPAFRRSAATAEITVTTEGANTRVALFGIRTNLDGSDQPGGDEPGGDEPGGDEPGGDEPGGDEPGPDQPSGDAAGTGTEADPFNVAAAIAKAKETGTTATADSYYITGTVTGTPDVSAQYKNATFDIVDKDGGDVFTVFRIKSFGGADFTGSENIKAGDKVVVYGQIVNYQGNKPETSAGGKLISLNGETSFGGDEPAPSGGEYASNVTWTYSSAEAAYNEKATVNGTADVPVLKLGNGSKYGSSTLTLPEGTTSLSFYAVSWKGAPATVIFKLDGDEVGYVQPAANDGLSGSNPYTLTVTEANKYMVTFPATNTIQVLTETDGKRAALFAIQAGTETGGNTGARPKKVSLAEFAAAEPSSTQPYQVTGTVTNLTNAQYGVFDLTDGTTTIRVNGLNSTDLGYGAQNDRTFHSMGIKATDNITIVGYRGSFNFEPQVEYAYIVRVNAKGSGDEPAGPDQPSGNASGTGTQADPFNVAAAINAVKNLTWTSNSVYDKVGPYYVKGKISRIANKGTFGESGTYGNASFYISDDGSESNEFYCFRILYFDNAKYTAGTDIKVGDEVVVSAELMNYKGETPETVSGKGHLVSLNGATSGGSTEPDPGTGGGDNPDPGTGTGGGDNPTGGATTVTIDFSTKGYENGEQYPSTVQDGVTVTFGDGGNDGKYYNAGTGMRFYGGGYCQISASSTITKIVYTFSGSSYAPSADNAPTMSTGTYDVSTSTWTGSATSVRMTRPTGSGHYRLQKVVVTLQ